MNEKLQWNGSLRTVNQHFQECLHHSVLMNYSDNLKNVQSWAKIAVNDAERRKRKVAIGSEVADLTGLWKHSERETWWEEIQSEKKDQRFNLNSQNNWEAMMNQLANSYKKNKGYDRLAIHSYSAYFYHWFGQYPRDYIQSQKSSKYSSKLRADQKVKLKKDLRPLVGN